ncbi:MAG: NAD(P)H-hydrate dehydratase, partial [Candidatus Lokiarchaeota archaeon]
YLIDWANAIVIGPGLGKEKETEELLVEILKYLKKNKKSFVLDADALKLIKNHLNLIKGQSCILTPHEGELKIMSGLELPSSKEVEIRMEKVHQLAKKLKVTLLVKGPYDYISNGKEIKINRTGCPEMAVGGTGDILAGLCTSFLATENSPFQAACSAAFLNGLLGEYIKDNYSTRFTSMDMIEQLKEIIKYFE